MEYVNKIVSFSEYRREREAELPPGGWTPIFFLGGILIGFYAAIISNV